MTCPHCNEDVELTSERCLSAPLGKFTCPHCGKRFRARLTNKQRVATVGLGAVLAPIPFAVAFYMKAGLLEGLVVIALCSVLIGLPIGVKLQEKWGHTVPIADEKREDDVAR